MIRAYGWRVGCPAAGVPGGGVGSVEWFGSLKSSFIFESLHLT
jgi:hypothetical protein